MSCFKTKESQFQREIFGACYEQYNIFPQNLRKIKRDKDIEFSYNLDITDFFWKFY